MLMDTTDTVQELRNARHTANSVFMQFTEDNDKFNCYAFCFFEGEDAKYYNSRIKKYFNNSFLSYTVGNKKEVLKLMKKIEGDSLYDKVVKMFFVDNDFDESVLGISPNLYETPCYSIENLYARKEVFQDIIQSEFGINRANEDYNKCVIDFENRFEEFITGMEEFNALVMLRRKKSELNSDFKFGGIKTSHLFDITIDRVTKSSRYEENINKIKEVLEVQEKELQESVEELHVIGEPISKYRGKNQLDFLCTLLKQLKELYNRGEYFSEKRIKVKLDITENRLSELSQYAITPHCLEVFLNHHSCILNM